MHRPCPRSRPRRRSAALAAGWLLAVGLAGGCASMQVTTDYDPEADFADLASYAWKPGPQPETGDPRLDNRLLDERIRRAIEHALKAKGYEKTTVDQADFLVGYHAAIEGKLDVQTMNDYYGYGYGWGWNYGMGPAGGYRGAPETHVRKFDEGMLIIDISDPATEKLIWRGSGQGELDDSRSPPQRERQVHEAVDEILKRFPPGQG